MQQKITPFLWFDGRAEEAANWYVSIFRNSRIGSITRCGAGGPGPAGSVLTVSFTLEGQEFIALNGGPMYQFSPAISFLVSCQTQAEIDELWAKLTAGGETQACGWLRDKFGVSWQITPAVLLPLLGDPDPGRAGRVMTAMQQMIKFDIQRLKDAAEGKPA